MFLWAIVPSLLFIFGCSRQEHSSAGQRVVTPGQHHQTSFLLTDVDRRSTTLSLRKGQLNLSRVMQPLVILHLFSTRSPLCRAMLPYLSDLQHQHSRDLFVLGIVVPEETNASSLRTFMQRNHTTFFVSHTPDNRPLASALADMLQLGNNYPLPLTLIFYRGKRIADYEGVTPIEMIRNDIQPHLTLPRSTH